MSKNKQPKNKIIPNPTKNPKIDFIQTKKGFTWSFSIIDLNGPFGWEHCKDAEMFLEVLKKKGQLEDKNFSELGGAGSHKIPISDISTEAFKRLREIKQDDIDEIFSFRLSGRVRFWCIRHDNVMRVLWWDPDHKVCPSNKKHT